MLEALTGPHRPLFDITVHHAALSSPLALPHTRAQLTFDETRAPYAQLKVDAPIGDAALDAVLDPRSGVRLHVKAGHILDGRPDRQLIADLGLRTRDRQTPEGTSAMNAASDEALVLDSAPARNDLTAPSVSAAIDAVLADVFVAPVIVSSISAGAAVSILSPNYTDKWRTIEDLADGLGDVWVYADEYRRWIKRPRPTLAADPVLQLGTGGVPILSLADATTREEWFNRVYLRYEWRDASGVDHLTESVREIQSGPHAAVLGNVRCHTETRTMPRSQASADNAATSLVRRLASRGRTIVVRSPAVWWLRPGMTIGVNRARHLVSSVMFDSSGWMEVATRYPDSTATIGG